MEGNRNVIFISHAAIDKEIASRLCAHIAPCFPQCEIFVSSDPGTLAPRDPWVQKILDHLHRAALVIVLASPRGLSRVWVWFEAGAAWGEVPTFISCCLGEMRKGTLPAPFALYSALNADDPRDLEALFSDIAKQCGLARSAPDYSQLASELKELESKVAQQQKVLEIPFYEERWKLVEATISNVEPSRKEALSLLVLTGSATDSYALTYLHSKGLAQNWSGVFEGLQNTTNLVQPVPAQNERLSTDQRQ